MNTTEKHNGWTNYATWRVALEIFGGLNVAEERDADCCKELAEGYANAFLSEVNWHEIAESINEGTN